MKAAFPPRMLGPALAGMSGVAMLGLYAVPTGTATMVAAVTHAATLVLAIGSLLLGPMSSRELRPARRLLAVAVFLSGAGMVIAGLEAENGIVPIPSLADVVSYSWPPLAVLGFWKVPRAQTGRTANARMIADAALCTSALLFTSWLTILGPVAGHHSGSALTTAVQAGYPLSDAFTAALALTLVPFVRSDLRGFFELVSAGLVLAALGDSGATLHVVQHGTSSFGWWDVPLQLGMALLVLAPWRQASIRKDSRARRLLEGNIAQASVMIAGIVSVWRVALGHPIGLVDCLLGVLMLTAGICRQLLHTSELLKLADSHRYAAEHDPLTGLASRHAFLEQLSAQLVSEGTVIGVAVLDIDGFQEVNDSFGQAIGDAALQAVSRRTKELSTPHLVARMGGDELAVLVVAPDAAERLERLTALLAGSQQVQAEDCSLDLGCSVGWVTAAPGDTAADVIARAELALQAAKTSPTQVAAYTEVLGAQSLRKRLVIAGLAHAVRRGELSLVYQPVQGLSDDRPVAVEALLRWRHPHLGNVPPIDFIPLAEESGHIRGLGTWVLRQAIGQLARWDEAGITLPQLFVNLSAKQLTDELPRLVLDLLATYDVAPHRLVLEVTESHLPDLTASAALARLREAGVQVALDDFGSGYSSLAQLVRLPIDILKLDRDLVVNLGQEGGEAVLTAAVALAHSLGMRTVTEGIETSAQLAAVRRAGADLGQGYLFSQPLPPCELLELLPSALLEQFPRPRDSRQEAAR